MLSPEQVQWVARLARLQFSDDELTRLRHQLDAILDYVNQLQEVETEGVEPLAHPLPVQNLFREDKPTESLPAEAALANAPDRRGEFFGVPQVLK